MSVAIARQEDVAKRFQGKMVSRLKYVTFVGELSAVLDVGAYFDGELFTVAREPNRVYVTSWDCSGTQAARMTKQLGLLLRLPRYQLSSP